MQALYDLDKEVMLYSITYQSTDDITSLLSPVLALNLSVPVVLYFFEMNKYII